MCDSDTLLPFHLVVETRVEIFEGVHSHESDSPHVYQGLSALPAQS